MIRIGAGRRLVPKECVHKGEGKQIHTYIYINVYMESLLENRFTLSTTHGLQKRGET